MPIDTSIIASWFPNIISTNMEGAQASEVAVILTMFYLGFKKQPKLSVALAGFVVRRYCLRMQAME